MTKCRFDHPLSEPIEAPVPEPGALAVLLVAIAGFVAHRFRERRRGL